MGTKMKRKEFINQLSLHLNDKKLAAKLGKLWKNMLVFDLSLYVKPKEINPQKFQKDEAINNKHTKIRNIWSNQPQSIGRCNIEQILYILDDIKVDSVQEHKNEIIKYIKKHQVDGKKLSEMETKPFMNELSEYLNDEKLKPALENLRESML